jgi:hypothetical protein
MTRYRSAAQFEFATHGSIAVEKHHGRTLAALDVMNAGAVDVNEAAIGRVLSLGAPRLRPDIQRSGAQHHRGDGCGTQPRAGSRQ